MLQLKIEASQSVKKIILTDAMGRKFTPSFAPQISVAHLPPGMFILELITEDEEFVKKLLKL